MKKLAWVALLLSFPLLMLRAETYPVEGLVKVSEGSFLNLRLKPDMSAPAIGKLGNNDKVIIIGKDKDFYQLQYPGQMGAWIAGWLLLENGKGDKDRVAREDVNVRSGPSMRHAIVSKLAKGQQVEILGRNENRWVRIALPDTVPVWAADRFIVVGEPLAIIKEREQKFQEVRTLFVKSESAIQAAIAAETITEGTYKALLGDLDKVILVQPDSAEAIKALSYKNKLSEFFRLVQLKNLKDEQMAKHKEEKKKIEETYQRELEELNKARAQTEQVYEFEGWVDDIGGIIHRPATHKLMEAEKTLCYLKPGKIADLDKYSGKRVGINGKVEVFRVWGRIITVDEITVLHENPLPIWNNTPAEN
ncbi:MAG: SH3 domain-containing protein [Planctomycetes bacterium]|nr:SH3 domain-containing protein [Planctomycetota bacterium]